MKFFTLLLSMFLLFSCDGQGKSESMKNYHYKTSKRTVYGMDLTIPGPYELYINDIAARKDYGAGMHNTFIEINPYVLKSGTYSLHLNYCRCRANLKKAAYSRAL